MLDVHALPAFRDNVIWAIRSPAIVIDPGDADPVLAWMAEEGIDHLDAILITHRHQDHTGGLGALMPHLKGEVHVGPASPLEGPNITSWSDGEVVHLPSHDRPAVALRVLTTPGHTDDHVTFITASLPPQAWVGDTLFSAGCGRCFDGTPDVLYHSLQRINLGPPQTVLYPAHNYTRDNLEFAHWVEPNNQHVQTALAECMQHTPPCEGHVGVHTLPTTLAHERLINPFLRCAEATVQQRVQALSDEADLVGEPIATFVALRRLKDSFQPPSRQP